MNNSFKLTIVTIYKGNDLKFLIQTLRSIKKLRYYSSQLEFEQILVLSTEAQIRTKRKIFKIILNQDHSLYNAMNLGLNIATGEKILFLNAGDIICQKLSYQNFQKEIQSEKCVSFKVNINYGKYYFINNKRKSFKCHNSFIAPIKKKIYFDENFKITSDAKWMRENISTFGIKYSNITLVEYLGFGLSDYPSYKTAIKYLKEKGYTKFFLRLIYILLYKTVPKSIFFKLLAYKRGYTLEKK